MTNFDAVVKIFERKCIQVLNYPECQTSCTSAESVIDISLRFNFSYSDADAALQNLKEGLCWDGIHTNHLNYFRHMNLNFLSEPYNEILSHP